MSYASLDKRRINGPDRVSQPIFRASESVAPGEAANAKGKSRQVEERSKRGDDGVRPIFLQLNLIPQANGSAYIECGGLKLACAVYGPRQVRSNNRQYTNQAEVNVECRYAPFAGSSRVKPGRDLESTALSSLIHTSLLPCIRLNLLPKASLDIYITILESDASLEGCASLAITAASASLASAGIEMWGLCVGSSAALVDVDVDVDGGAGKSQKGRERRTLVDPTREEAAQSSGTVALCSMPALGSITSLEQSGTVSFEELDQVVETLTKTSAQIHLVVAEALQEMVTSRRPR
ncbi:mRNA transport regulator 3 [Microstroma glucosiphilum]|uniref:mRNA transport regulator 3 n=1 Tax=Pseudomicrostroma glucosiphilum TaxID=1684307 RepID=A0A316UDL0_9BASI|nr:mRNA transport regulator 3 [Pseudomicrostroma glucosiphilum]PWN23252.1 mRNA transport regulator 3 [Pseudomicrostroma glucosiphilum]